MDSDEFPPIRSSTIEYIPQFTFQQWISLTRDSAPTPILQLAAHASTPSTKISWKRWKYLILRDLLKKPSTTAESIPYQLQLLLKNKIKFAGTSNPNREKLLRIIQANSRLDRTDVDWVPLLDNYIAGWREMGQSGHITPLVVSSNPIPFQGAGKAPRSFKAAGKAPREPPPDRPLKRKEPPTPAGKTLQALKKQRLMIMNQEQQIESETTSEEEHESVEQDTLMNIPNNPPVGNIRDIILDQEPPRPNLLPPIRFNFNRPPPQVPIPSHNVTPPPPTPSSEEQNRWVNEVLHTPTTHEEDELSLIDLGTPIHPPQDNTTPAEDSFIEEESFEGDETFQSYHPKRFIPQLIPEHAEAPRREPDNNPTPPSSLPSSDESQSSSQSNRPGRYLFKHFSVNPNGEISFTFKIRNPKSSTRVMRRQREQHNPNTFFYFCKLT